MFLTFIASFHAVLQERKRFENFLEDDGHRREEERKEVAERTRVFLVRERHVLQVELMMKTVDRWARRRIAERLSGGSASTWLSFQHCRVGLTTTRTGPWLRNFWE